MKATSSRRQLIVAVLLAFAVLGAAIRHFAANPSLARDVGTLLLVLWLPVIGNLVAFVMGRLRRRRAFQPDSPFKPHLRIEIAPVDRPATVAGLPRNQRNCTLAVGSDGFTARLPMALAECLVPGEVQAVPVELLRPALALPRLVPGTVIQVLSGQCVVGSGRVLRPEERGSQ